MRSEDGSHFVLNGQKQFITNGSWADLAEERIDLLDLTPLHARGRIGLLLSAWYSKPGGSGVARVGGAGACVQLAGPPLVP